MIDTTKTLQIDLTAKRFAPLPPAQQKELIRLAQQGDKRAENRVVETTLRFVANVARQFKGTDAEHSDLFADGVIGLREAVLRFDAARGVKFISYAVWWVRAYINRAIDERGSTIRTPSRASHKKYQHLAEASALVRNTLSLDLMADDTNWHPADPDPGAEACAVEASRRQFVDKWLGVLSDKERYVIRRRYGIDAESCGDPQLLDTVAKDLGLSKERVRQIQDVALRRLRNHPLCRKIKMGER